MPGYPCCCERCPACTGWRSDEVEVVLSGIGDTGCGDCNGLNDTFILTWDGADTIGAGDPICRWKYVFDATCGMIVIQASVYYDAVTLKYRVQVELCPADPCAGFHPFFFVASDAKPACAFDAVVCAPAGGYSNWLGCDYDTTAQAVVTAL